MRELDDSFDMPTRPARPTAAASAPITPTLHGERKDIETQLDDLAADAAPAPAPDLVSLLPEVTADLAALPPALQAELFEVFDIQIIWNAPMRQATFRATITDTTPAIVTALLARASDDPSHDTKSGHPTTPLRQQPPHQGKHHPRTLAGIHSHPYTAGELCPTPAAEQSLPSPAGSPTGHRVDGSTRRHQADAGSVTGCPS